MVQPTALSQATSCAELQKAAMAAVQEAKAMLCFSKKPDHHFEMHTFWQKNMRFHIKIPQKNPEGTRGNLIWAYCKDEQAWQKW